MKSLARAITYLFFFAVVALPAFAEVGSDAQILGPYYERLQQRIRQELQARQSTELLPGVNRQSLQGQMIIIELFDATTDTPPCIADKNGHFGDCFHKTEAQLDHLYSGQAYVHFLQSQTINGKTYSVLADTCDLYGQPSQEMSWSFRVPAGSPSSQASNLLDFKLEWAATPSYGETRTCAKPAAR